MLAAFLCACSTSSPKPTRLSEAELETRIAPGRALLEAGKPAEAEVLFAAAATADGDSLRARTWVLRAWMDQGRNNDTLDELDALDRGGEKGMDLTYLYGMTFARRAEGYVADGVSDASVRMNFVDAADFLERAVRADPVRYHDAFLPLAGAAWYVEKPELARFAAERAVEVDPASAPAWLLRGRIALAQFAEAERAEPGSSAAEGRWSEAAHALQRALELFAAPNDEDARTQLADAATQLGHARLWRKLGPEATDAYATAIAWNPLGFPYAQAVEYLRGVQPSPDDERPSGFRAALELGRTRLESQAGTGDPRAGTLLWYLGWARFVDADWDGAEEAFHAALARGPQFSNAWFYVGLARQYRQDSEGAVAAMHAGWNADPVAMVAAVEGALGSQRAFENLLGWCASQEPPRNLDAAFLAEMLAGARPHEARHWNNLGLFLRDEGERLELEAHRDKLPKPDAALLDGLYERSFRAYERALELTPDDPQLLNDTALMLIYHVGPDFPRAQGMFERALALIEAQLARPDLSEEDRQRLEQNLADAKENLQAILDHFSGKDAVPEDGAVDAEKDAHGERAAEASSDGGG